VRNRSASTSRSAHRALDSKDFDADLRGAVREFAVLHRAEICEDVTTRTRKYLAG
jgi:hypothetical protein